jgi:hypothetical protein
MRYDPLNGVILLVLSCLLIVGGGLLSVFFLLEGDWGWGVGGLVVVLLVTMLAVRLGLRRFSKAAQPEKLSWPVRIVLGLLGLLFLVTGALEIFVGFWDPSAAPALGVGIATAGLGFFAIYFGLVRGEDPEMAESNGVFVPAGTTTTQPDQRVFSGPVPCGRCGKRSRTFYLLNCCGAAVCWKCLKYLAHPAKNTCELCLRPLVRIPEGPPLPRPAPAVVSNQPVPAPSSLPTASKNPQADRQCCYFCGRALELLEWESRVCNACRVRK